MRVVGHLALLLLALLLVGCGATDAESTTAATAAALRETSAPASTLPPTSSPSSTTPTVAPSRTAALPAARTPRPTPSPVLTSSGGISVRIVTPVARAPWRYEIIGYSAGGHAVEAFRFGNGPRELLFVGGHHGGYEWNTILLAYAVADYFAAYPETVPPNVTVTVIPSANPDGQLLVTGRRGRFSFSDITVEDTVAGRFNANGVDLNRNWDCVWAPVGEWRGMAVSGGSAPFSEPENQALLAYVQANRPELVVFWHSAVPGVFYGRCDGAPLPQTITYGDAYAAAAGYEQSATFGAYALTGDAANSLATLGIPSFAVELTNHNDLDLDQNLRGVLAVLDLVP